MRDGTLADERHTMSEISESQKDQASIWFMSLRDEIVQAFLKQHRVKPVFKDALVRYLEEVEAGISINGQ